MTLEELNNIKGLAAGNTNLKNAAIIAFRKYRNQRETRKTNAMEYMSEVDNPHPDYILRNRYRRLLLEE